MAQKKTRTLEVLTSSHRWITKEAKRQSRQTKQHITHRIVVDQLIKAFRSKNMEAASERNGTSGFAGG